MDKLLMYYIPKQGTDTHLLWENGVLQTNVQNTKTDFSKFVIGRMNITASKYVVMVTNHTQHCTGEIY